jgi:hypothetical protein
VLEGAAAHAGGTALGGRVEVPEHARLQVDSLLAVIAALETRLDTIDCNARQR